MSITVHKTDSTLAGQYSVTNTSNANTKHQPSIYMEENTESKATPRADSEHSFIGFVKNLLGWSSDNTEEKTLPAHKNAKADPKTAGEEIGERFAKYDKNDEMFIKELEYLVNTNSSKVFEWASYNYAVKTEKSLIVKIEGLSKTNNIADLKAKLEENVSESNYFKREYLAYNLVNALNSEDTAKIDELINSINTTNLKGVYSAYRTVTKTTKEESYQDSYLNGNKRKWLGGKSSESLLQGILNNKHLSTEQKEDYIYHIVDCATSYNRLADRKAADYLSKHKRSMIDEAFIYNNTFNIDKTFSKMFGF